jgi:hypothetical protein
MPRAACLLDAVTEVSGDDVCEQGFGVIGGFGGGQVS